jgi:hypothetical protein
VHRRITLIWILLCEGLYWIRVAENRDKCLATVNTAVILLGSVQYIVCFFDELSDCVLCPPPPPHSGAADRSAFVVHVTARMMARRLVNNELERVWEEAAVA